MFEVKGVSKQFGGVTALRSVSLRINDGEMFGLIGPNGAGKTTLFNIISGIYRPDEGSIWFKGENITGYKPHQISTKGIGRTFQLVKPFSNVSVLDNVTIGALCRVKDAENAKEEAVEVLEVVGLLEKKDILAKNLTPADRKRLELARALATKPRLLLLDEIMGGLNPTEMGSTIALIRRVHRSGITLFIIEHIMRVIMTLSNRITVIHHGEKIAEGTPEEIAINKRVIEAYLGEEYVFRNN